MCVCEKEINFLQRFFSVNLNYYISLQLIRSLTLLYPESSQIALTKIHICRCLSFFLQNISYLFQTLQQSGSITSISFPLLNFHFLYQSLNRGVDQCALLAYLVNNIKVLTFPLQITKSVFLSHYCPSWLRTPLSPQSTPPPPGAVFGIHQAPSLISPLSALLPPPRALLQPPPLPIHLLPVVIYLQPPPRPLLLAMLVQSAVGRTAMAIQALTQLHPNGLCLISGDLLIRLVNYFFCPNYYSYVILCFNIIIN